MSEIQDQIKHDLEMGSMMDLVIDHVESENWDDAYGALDEALGYLDRALERLEKMI